MQTNNPPSSGKSPLVPPAGQHQVEHCMFCPYFYHSIAELDAHLSDVHGVVLTRDNESMLKGPSASRSKNEASKIIQNFFKRNHARTSDTMQPIGYLPAKNPWKPKRRKCEWELPSQSGTIQNQKPSTSKSNQDKSITPSIEPPTPKTDEDVFKKPFPPKL